VRSDGLPLVVHPRVDVVLGHVVERERRRLLWNIAKPRRAAIATLDDDLKPLSRPRSD
jgi:hypothetical protein